MTTSDTLRTLLSAGLMTCGLSAFAQAGVAINADGAPPHPSAILDVDVSALPENAKKGLLVPWVTTNAQRTSIPSPANGLLVYQRLPTTNRGFWHYDGSTWVRMGLTAWNLTGNAGTTSSFFLGTTDAQPLVFRTNNIERMRITTRGQWEPANTQHSIYIGEGAGELDATAPATQASNVFVGWQAGHTARGQRNVAIGAEALRNSGTTYENTALGNQAMALNTTGNYNTAIGSQAGPDAPGTWSHGTAVGHHALARAYGTAIGAGSSATGDSATAVGHGATAAFTNSTAVGSGSTTTAPAQVRIGNAAVTSIGGYAPWTDLSDIRFKTDVEPLAHGLDLVRALRPITYRIDVRGLERFIGTAAPSDEASARRKEAIRYSGFSAQEVEAIALRIGYDFNGVHVPQNEHDPYGLNYAVFVVPLVKALQELDQEQLRLTEELQELEKRLERLEGHANDTDRRP